MIRRLEPRGFTLLELLTTTAVLGILASMMIARFYEATDRTRLAGCRANLRNVAAALQVYSNDFGGRFPSDLAALTGEYLQAMPTCPAAGGDTYTAGYALGENSYTVSCSGHHHATMNLAPNTPWYTPEEGLGP